VTGPYELSVAGRLPSSVAETIGARLGDDVRIRPIGSRTVLNIEALDQPALRALLNLLWDVGLEVLSVSIGRER
jgi:hypothetical protein